MARRKTSQGIKDKNAEFSSLNPMPVITSNAPMAAKHPLKNTELSKLADGQVVVPSISLNNLKGS